MTTKVFGATWCANCTTAKKFLDSKGFAFEYVDIDQNMEDAQANQIRSLPTMVTENGDRLVGSQKIIDYVNSQGN